MRNDFSFNTQKMTTFKTLGLQPLFPSACLIQCHRHKSFNKLIRIKASTSDANSSKGKNPFTRALETPRVSWNQTIKPLTDFGFGRRSIWDGGVGLFIVTGVVLFALTLAWLKGFQLRSRFRKYETVFEFTQASGICAGTPIRIRGVTVGNVVRVDSSLKCIDAVAEIDDDKVIIPRNSLVEVNQSGLLMETLIDVTPRDPLPKPSVGPLDQDCVKEGLIVCDKERIKGQQGVSLDELVGIATRLGQEAEEIGITKSYELAEKIAAVALEAQPLLEKVEAMAEDIQPLLSEVRNTALLKDAGILTKSLAEATEELRYVHSSILTPENAELVKKSIVSLIFTLKNVENITSDITGFTGDEAVRRNLKMLIKSLSRLL